MWALHGFSSDKRPLSEVPVAVAPGGGDQSRCKWGQR